MHISLTTTRLRGEVDATRSIFGQARIKDPWRNVKAEPFFEGTLSAMVGLLF
jgi:hypothetical protein